MPKRFKSNRNSSNRDGFSNRPGVFQDDLKDAYQGFDGGKAFCFVFHKESNRLPAGWKYRVKVLGRDLTIHLSVGLPVPFKD